jgi:hypothetical protein
MEMAIPPAKIRVGACYCGDGNLDRRVIELADERVRFETRPSNTTQSFGSPRAQSLRAFARLVFDEIDPQTGKIIPHQ